MIDLNIVWYVLVGVLFAGYAMLDGFDFGVGALHLFTKSDEHRRLMLNSIGPVWDGNEVWLVTGGGALFAAFPEVYATVFSGFYIAFMLLLVALIFRAIAIEFRSKQPMLWWRRMWDISFSVSSIIASILVGTALGNIICGVPLGKDYEYIGTFLGLLRPYPVLVGLTTLSLFMMHGSIYAIMKTEGELHDKIRGWAKRAILGFIAMYIITTIVTLVFYPHMLENMKKYPVLFIIPVINALAIANIFREIHLGRDFRAFLSSCVSIVALMALFAIGIFPNLVISSPDLANSLNIYNAASTKSTLKTMLIIAIIGMPFVIAYTISIYWIFRGKVRLNDTSY